MKPIVAIALFLVACLPGMLVARSFEALQAALKDSDSQIRLAAVTEFGQMGGSFEAARGLSEALHNDDPMVAFYAAKVIGDVGSKTTFSGTVPALIEVREDRTVALMVRDEALDAMVSLAAKCGSACDQLSQEFEHILDDPNANDHVAALEGLYKINWRDPKIAPALGVLLKDNEKLIRREAAKAFHEMPPAAQAQLTALVAALDDFDAEVRAEAALAIGEASSPRRLDMGHTPFGAEALPALIKALKDEAKNVRAGAGNALGEIGLSNKDLPALKEAVGGLKEALGDAEKDVRFEAAIAISGIDGSVAGIAPILIKALQDPDPLSRERASAALIRVPKLPAPAGPVLVKALKDSDAKVRLNVAYSIGWLKPPAAGEIPALLEVLANDKDEEVRHVAAVAIETNVGPSTKGALPVLVKALNDPNRDVRYFSAMALGYLGPTAKSAVPALKKLADDKDPALAAVVKTALKQIRP